MPSVILSHAMGAFWHQLNKHDVEESAPGVPVFFRKWKRFSVLEKVLCIRNKS